MTVLLIGFVFALFPSVYFIMEEKICASKACHKGFVKYKL